MSHEPNASGVTDADIEAILAVGEAGIGDLMATYEPVERHYFAAIDSSKPAVTYGVNTTTPSSARPIQQ